MAVIPIAEPQRKSSPPPKGFGLFALGFRPFYLLAASLAVLFVPLWLMTTLGKPVVSPALPPLLWHGHEMIFGFACAVIVGFLLTAARNWTGLPTPSGLRLAALAALWLLARIALLTQPLATGATLDLLFLPLAAVMLAVPLFRAGNQRNYFVLGVLAALALSNLAFYAAVTGRLAISPLNVLHVSVAVIATLTTVIAGRIVPSFTANALKTVPRKQARVDQLAIASTAIALLLWASDVQGPVAASVALMAAVSQIWRCLGWRPGPTWRVPLLWILHLSHGWLIVALLATASAASGLPGGAVVLHVLTVGLISGLILSMITRTTLGHTGRLLKAGPIETSAFMLLQGALLARVLPPLIAPELYRIGLMVSGTAWALCFVLYLIRYAPMLVTPRIDGREG